MVEGYGHGLAQLDELAANHPHLARIDAVRAHLLERAGRTNEAIDAYRRAIAATVNVAEQRHLRDRLLRLQSGAVDAAAGSNPLSSAAP
jgi:predicted RNA polymerase sigma factor